MEKVRLEMDFLDVMSKQVRISLDNPKNGLTGTQIEEAMQDIITHNIFESKEGALVEIKGARVVTTTVSDFEF